MLYQMYVKSVSNFYMNKLFALFVLIVCIYYMYTLFIYFIVGFIKVLYL